MKFLDNGHVRLRAVEPEDAGLMWEVETDTTQWRDNGMSAPYSRRNLREYAENYDADPIRAGQLRLIAQLDDGAVFGLADIYDISPTTRTAFVGIYVLEKYRRHGLASEILGLLEEYARQLLNLRILGAKISETNLQSVSMFEKAGFRKEATISDWLLSGRNTYALLIYTKKL